MTNTYATDPAAGTVLVTIENRSAANETFQVLVGGVSQAMLTVPAGAQGQVSVRADVATAHGSSVRIEAITASGRRASQDVFVGADGTAQVALRIE
jgi:hypothetical protein